MGFIAQAATKNDRRMKGAQALKTCPPVYLSCSRPVAAASCSKRQLSFGVQNWRKSTVPTMEAIEARMSGSIGPRKLEDKYCVMAKEAPETSAMGQTSKPFF